MTASEAKEKMKHARAKKSVQRIFPVFQKAIDKGEGGVKLNIINNVKEALDALTEEEFEILRTEYKYKLQAVYDDSGDYHRSDKKISYWVLWE